MKISRLEFLRINCLFKKNCIGCDVMITVKDKSRCLILSIDTDDIILKINGEASEYYMNYSINYEGIKGMPKARSLVAGLLKIWN